MGHCGFLEGCSEFYQLVRKCRNKIKRPLATSQESVLLLMT